MLIRPLKYINTITLGVAFQQYTNEVSYNDLYRND